MKNILIKAALRLIVFKCPSCGKVVKDHGTLCPECLEKYRSERDRPCHFCGLPAPLCVCSTRDLYYSRSLGETMRSLLFYESGNEVFSSSLKMLKYSPDRSAERLFARELSCEMLKLFASAGEISGEWYVTYPPRRNAAVMKYGFDQSRGLAESVAKFTGMKFFPAFGRRGKVAQKTLGTEERRVNAEGSFFLKKGVDPAGKKFVIVDDVVTSGATMKACQTLLFRAGATDAFVLSVSKTPMRGAGYDKKRPFRRRKSDLAWFNKR